MTIRTTLVDVATLEAHLADPQWVVVDCRHDLADPERGRREYEAGHIPGARFAHLNDDLSGPRTGMNGRHPLPDAQQLAQIFGRWGIDRAKQVVAYDAQGGMYAARLWWLLRWLGHDRVAVLDGGLQAWTAAGQPLVTNTPTPAPTHFEAQPRDAHVNADAILSDIGRGLRRVIDARAPDRYRGENETLDPVGGHIPGARNRFFRDNLLPDGRFKSAEVLRAEWRAALEQYHPEQIIHQCGSGVTACHNALAMEIAGLSGSKLYPGSWSEWCADPHRPVARGNDAP